MEYKGLIYSYPPSLSTPSLESGPLSHKSQSTPPAPRERNRRQVLINFIFFPSLKAVVLNPGLHIRLSRGALETPVLRPHPRPIKPDSLGGTEASACFF